MNPEPTDVPSRDEMLAFRLLARRQLSLGTEATFQAVSAAQPPAAARGAAKRGAAKRGLRSAAAGGITATAQVLLVEDSRGLLHWEYEPAMRRGMAVEAGMAPGLRAARRGRYRAAGVASDRIVAAADAADVGPNQLTEALEKLDRILTPERGLRLFHHSLLAPGGSEGDALKNATRVLLLVHGTFSSGESYQESLAAEAHGQAFLRRAQAHYSHVASFDHPTLSVSPMLNAIDLEQSLRRAGLPQQTPVDVVCHSRGGLVVAWWLRGTRFQVDNLVAVAAPLVGTSLASPYRIRHLLDYVANYARMMSTSLRGAAMVPSFASGFLAGAGGLVGVLGGVTGALGSLPIADAAIALVPGLHGMSRVKNNLELLRLWGDGGFTAAAQERGTKCYVIGSNFEPRGDARWWQLVEQLRRLPWGAADTVADALFPGPNDLVVDTDAMEFDQADDKLIFTGVDAVHHCAYFTHKRTLEAMAAWLKVPG